VRIRGVSLRSLDLDDVVPSDEGDKSGTAMPKNAPAPRLSVPGSCGLPVASANLVQASIGP
jgi:hypothetical protein